MMPLPAEPAALQGWDPTLVIVDELHVVTDRVWEAMSLASGKRLESLTLAISTPSDRLDSVMWRLVEYGRQHPDDKSDRKSTRLNSSHVATSYAVFCLKKQK